MAWSGLNSQVTTERDVIAQALIVYPSLRMANLDVQQKKALERTAFNPSQPSFAVEFPTDIDFSFEAEQEFDFPLVYTRRSKWLKSQTRLASEAVAITKGELIRRVRLDYLDAQFIQAQIWYLTSQDSLWREITLKSNQLFDGGEITKADLLFAEKQASLINFSLANAVAEYNNQLATIGSYMNQPIVQVEDLQPLPFDVDTMNVFYFEKYLSESKHVAQNEIAVRKAERWPGLLLGYLRVDELDTDYRYRYKAGITVPIWQGQYKGEVESSKAELEKLQAETELEIRQARLERIKWRNKLLQAMRSLEWFETVSLPQAEELITVYRRLFDAGQVDYPVTLRNITDVLLIQSQYLETLKTHNESIIELDFLQGKSWK